MNKLLIPALLAATVFSANAFAGHDDDYWEKPRHHRAKHVVVHHVHEAPEVIYAPPTVIYRDRIVYRDHPVYYEAPTYYERPAATYAAPSQRVMGQTLGAIAGGAIGSQLGQGNGRVAATAIGAVVGSVLGGSGY